MHHRSERQLQITVSPHPIRGDDWSVLRVVFPRDPDHERRIAWALDALIGPTPPPVTAPRDTAEGRSWSAADDAS